LIAFYVDLYLAFEIFFVYYRVQQIFGMICVILMEVLYIFINTLAIFDLFDIQIGVNA